jgi:hypothetical protein
MYTYQKEVINILVILPTLSNINEHIKYVSQLMFEFLGNEYTTIND